MIARLAVTAAAAMLPARLRERYREQWLADLRDAPAAGIRPSQIAVGSLAFAITLDRPISRGAGELTPASFERRSRYAAGLALGSALVAISQYASVVMFGGLIGVGVYDYAMSFLTALLLAYAVLAPLTAVLIVTFTRGTHPRVRLAVWLLVVASCAGGAQRAIDSGSAGVGNIYLTPGTLAYPAALALVIAAVRLLRRPAVSRMPVRTAALAGLAVLATGGLGLLHASVVWAGRTPLEFAGPEVGLANWESLKQQSEQTVNGVLIGWAIASVLAAVAVVVAARRGVASIVWLAMTGMAVLLIAHAAVMGFLQLGSGSAVPLVPTEVLLLAGRWGLVAAALATVGGVRLTRRREPLLAPVETPASR